VLKGKKGPASLDKRSCQYRRTGITSPGKGKKESVRRRGTSELVQERTGKALPEGKGVGERGPLIKRKKSGFGKRKVAGLPVTSW